MCAKPQSGGEEVAETLDCVVASIGDDAITAGDVVEEYRLEEFLNGRPVKAAPDRETAVQIRERLIERKLLAEEAAALPSSTAEAEAAAKRQWEDVRKLYATPEAFQAALRSLGTNPEQVLAKLGEEQKVLVLVDRRLRPQAAVEPSEIEAYYRDKFTPDFKNRSAGNLPPLSQVEGRIREILVQQKIDGLLGQWMEELKISRRVVLHSLCNHERG